MEVKCNDTQQRLWKTYHMEIPYSGLARLDQSWKQDRVSSPFSRLYYILDGEGQLLLDGQSMPLKAGNVYLLPAGLIYGYDCPHFMEQLFFHINYTYLNGIDLFLDCRKVCERALTAQEMQQLRQLYLSEQLPDACLLKALLLKELSGFISAAQVKEAHTRNLSPLVERMFYLAQNPVHVKNRVSTLAKQLHVAPSTLSKHFHQETGMTPGEYMEQLIINRACSLLLTEDYSIARIAEELGFSDQFYFTKYFKRQMFISPSEYRKQMITGVSVQQTPPAAL